MGQHLNRLNAEESLKWDEAYERFCETGKWEECKMKAFKKWYTELPMREDVEDFTITTQTKYRKGWRAALEEVLKQANLPSSVDKVDIMNWIEKELGEDDET